MLRLLQGTRSRVLAADTQRYSMLLSSSYHPSLMMDGAEREIFFHSLWKGRGEDDRQIVESEIKSLLNGDIPYFYYCLDGRNLVMAQGEEMTGYFACSGMGMMSGYGGILYYFLDKKYNGLIRVSSWSIA